MDSNSNPTTTTLARSSKTSQETVEMFRPPINRAMRVLDRSFFRRVVPLSAATVFENKQIATTKGLLDKTGETLHAARIMPVRPALNKEDAATVINRITHVTNSAERNSGSDPRKKCLLLDGKVRYDDVSTWSPTLQELVTAKTVELGPYNIELDYDYWSYHDIISAILPEEDLDETPAGFTQVGHVAHLNLREQYLPYKYLIAEILKDKAHGVQTVINKLDGVGTESKFRTFPYEVLSGSGDMNVTVSEQKCEFRFNYAKVYWNTRLGTEHTRLVNKFKMGEMVCDVMAGVGPFAIPAGKKGIFVWANDLNPHGYECMASGILLNKVGGFVKPFNMDAREFINHTRQIPHSSRPRVKLHYKVDRKEPPQPKKGEESPPPGTKMTKSFRYKTLIMPPTPDHFVMNLPATAIEFLDAFIGLYAGQERRFQPHTKRKLPMIHVYCFSTHSENEDNELIDICNRISERMGFTLTKEDKVGGSGNQKRELEIHNVRLVSPNKQMFCASFRLPDEVAFAKKR